MYKKYWLSIILCVIGLIVFMSIAVLGDWYGFGVDSTGLVYIGAQSQIHVYENRQLIGSIEVPPNRAYYFTVQNDDTILLSTSIDIFVMDFRGNVLSCRPDDGNMMFNELQWKHEFETKGGELYYCRNYLGFRIIENDSGNVVYQTPFVKYWERLSCCIVVFALIVIAEIRVWSRCAKK